MKQSKRQKQPKQLKRPKRLKQNRNHTLHYNQEYSPKENVTLPVLTQDGPVITSYLDRAFKVFDKALDAHSKVLVVRFDLKVPAQISLPENAGGNGVIRLFLDSLEAKIEANLHRKGSPHKCPVRYIIAREIGDKNQGLHYHVMLLLNGHAFRHIGAIESEEDNPFWLIVGAWASALKTTDEEAVDGVQFGFNRKGVRQYYLDPSLDYHLLPDAFRRSSYLCKAHTKHFGEGHHGLMTSRK